MTELEALMFQDHPLFHDILRLRAWDEGAKVLGGPGLDLNTLRDMAVRYREG